MPNLQNDYRIYTDATADLPEQLATELGVNVIPMEVDVGGKTYLFDPSGKELSPATFYEKCRAGQSATTSQITKFRFEEIFSPVLEAGEDILYIAFSSALSGTYEAACLAASALAKKYPERRLVVVDSRAASLGEALLVYHAAKRKASGMTIDEVEAWILANRDHVCHWFTVEDLMHLKKGGRVSATAAVMGTMLQIKPVLHVDNEGRLIPVSKVRGRRSSLKALVKEMEKTHLAQENDLIIIGHGDSEEDALYVKSLVAESLGYKNFLVNYIGPVIGAHSGPGTIALFFLGSKK